MKYYQVAFQPFQEFSVIVFLMFYPVPDAFLFFGLDEVIYSSGFSLSRSRVDYYNLLIFEELVKPGSRLQLFHLGRKIFL